MNIAFDITHPADVHQFKHCIQKLKQQGHSICITARNTKTIINLLQLYRIDFSVRRNGTGFINRAKNIIPIISDLYRKYSTFQPDLLIGSSGNIYIANVAKLLHKKSIIFDDTEHTRLQNLMTFPFASYICTPACYQLDKGKKHVRYNGSKELAYLHPNHYQYNETIFRQKFRYYLQLAKHNALLEEIEKNKKIILIRLVAWKAAHDYFKNSLIVWQKIIEQVKNFATVLVVADDSNNIGVNRSNLTIPSDKFHDLISFSDLVISEGATTAAEAAVLGKPAIFCNKHRLGYIDEYSRKYGLVQQIVDPQLLVQKIEELSSQHNLKENFRKKQQQLLADKIDVSQWMIEFISKVDPGTSNGKRKVYLISKLDPLHVAAGGIESYVSNLSNSLIKNNYALNIIGVSENTNGGNTKKFQQIAHHKHISVYHNKKSTPTNNFNFISGLLFKGLFLSIDSSSILHFQRPDWAFPFFFKKNIKLCSVHGNPAETIKHTKSKLYYRLYNFLEKLTLPTFDKIAFVDYRTKNIYLKKYPGLTPKMIVIPPTFDEHFHRLPPEEIHKLKMKFGITKDERIILIIARLEREKNILEMLDIIFSLKIYQQKLARLFIVGTGSLEPAIKLKAEQTDQNNIFMFHHISREYLPHIYNMADVTFLFSLTEGLPIVALESLACGTPVVCNDVGDLSKLIRNGYNGYIVNRNTVRQILDQILVSGCQWQENCIESVRDYQLDMFEKNTNVLYN